MDITKKNFASEFENITNNLKQSCFVGFDAEFTALLSGECFKHRLFDTNEERYNKMQAELSKMIMSQVGLTMFQYNRDHDSYNAVGYTFHLCPQVLGDIDQSFIFQASTLKFLCKHNFNFNKFIYDGIPYLSKAEEEKIIEQIKNNNLVSYLTCALEIDDEKQLQYYCSEVCKWLNQNEGDTMYIDMHNPILRYLIHVEVRERFPNVFTTDSLGNSNKILIYRNKHIEGANSAPMEILEKNLMNHLLGLSRIIQLLVQHRKPLIGHNIFMDLLLLHNQFIGPLPKKFVRIFSEAKCKKLQNGINFIKLTTPFDVSQSYHEAGWDSYCSGYCFIRLGHWAACENIGCNRPVGPNEKLAAMATYCNKVNVIRGATPYMNLGDGDPPSHRPNMLHIKSLKERIINVDKVAREVAGLGAADVRAHGSRAALIAAGSRYTADKILNKFRDSRDYRVSSYKAFRHSAAGRIAIWSGALITGSLLLVLLHKRM